MCATVLIVDDDPVLGVVLQRWLRYHGFEVTVRHSLAEALGDLKALDPMAALVDLNLPDGSGKELVARIHAQLPACSAYIMSGQPERETRAQLRDLPLDGYLEKPIPPERVADLAERLRYSAPRTR